MAFLLGKAKKAYGKFSKMR